jgi:preprotein translocase subunit SecB
MTEQATNQQQGEKQVAIQRIYLKDVSFEAPNSPEIFRTQGEPTNSFNLNTAAKKVEENLYEVTLTLTFTVKVGEKTAYLIEVQQAGLFVFAGFTDQELGPMLGAYAPNQLFPYAREVITELVGKGSFPQMVLQPLNFEAIYMQQQQKRAQQAQASDQGQAETPATH